MKPCPSNNKSVKRRDISRRELFINRETTLEPPINTFGGPFLVKKKKKKKKKRKKKDRPRLERFTRWIHGRKTRKRNAGRCLERARCMNRGWLRKPQPPPRVPDHAGRVSVLVRP